MAGLDPELIERLRARAEMNRREREREELRDAWITAALRAVLHPPEHETAEDREWRLLRARAAREEFYDRHIALRGPRWGR